MNIQVRVTAAQAQREIDYLRKKIRVLEAEMGRANAAGSSMTMGGINGLTKWGSQVQYAGRQIQRNFTIPLLASGAVVTNWALENEAALVRIQKVYGDASNSTQLWARDSQKLIQVFELLSERYGVHQAQVREIAGEWAAAGASGAALANGVESTLKTMILGELDAVDATEALISIQAQWGASSEGLIDIINKMNATENATGITFKGLVEGMQRSSSTARTAGVSVDQLLGMLAAMTPASGSAAQSGNALKTVMSRLLSPTKEAAEVMGLMGINTADVSWKTLSASKRLEAMARRYHELSGSADGMVSAQAAVVSAVVASRYQINRFDTLMRDIYNSIDKNAKTNGYYGKTLDILSDKTEVLRAAQNELNRVLESSPVQMKRAGVIIQNSFMKVITALLPQIIYFANQVALLAKKFANLDPRIQKAILGFLAFFAVIGPPIVLLGTTAVALSQVAKALLGLSLPFKFVFGSFRLLTGILGGFAASVSGVFGRVSSIVTGTIGSFAKLGPGVSAASATSVKAIKAIASSAFLIPSAFAKARLATMTFFGIFSAGSASAAGIIGGISNFTAKIGPAINSSIAKIAPAINSSIAKIAPVINGSIASFSKLGSRIVAIFTGIGPRIVAFFAGIGPRIAAAFANIGPALLGGLKTAMGGVFGFLRAAGPVILRFLTGPWGLAITAIVTLLYAFRNQIAKIFNNIGRMAQDATNPFAQAWQGVVNLFNQGVNAANRAFQALPEGVRNALIAVITMVRDAALQVYEWFQYLNPFARHSPSLVENVTNGMAVVGERVTNASNVVKAQMLSAYQSMKKFGEATAGLISKAAALDAAKDRAQVAKADPSVLGVYDALVAKLGTLKSRLDTVGAAMERQQGVVDALEAAMERQRGVVDALQETYDQLAGAAERAQARLDAAQQKLDSFSNVGISGQREMSDAIFQNEMAQKKLRLEILRLQNSGQSVENLRDKLGSLQGDIEKLRGEAADLRAAGAGSDILGPIEAQINAMQTQYKALEKGANEMPVNDLQAQLEELQRKGEMLDLENSLKFDPLTRQLSQLTDGYKELPFDQIKSGIITQQQEVARLQSVYDQANAAVEKQGAVLDAAKGKLDTATKAYDTQNKILDGMKSVYSAIEEQIRSIESAIRDVISAASKMNDALETAKRDRFSKNTNKNELKNLRKKGSSSLPSDNMSPGAKNFKDATGGAFRDFGGTDVIGAEGGSLDKWLDDFAQGTSDMFKDFDIFGPIREKWDAFKSWWDANVTPIWDKLKQGFSSVFEGVDFMGPIRSVGEFFTGDNFVMNAVRNWMGRMKAVFEEAWNNIQESVGDAADKIGEKLKPIWGKIGGFKGLLKGLAGTVAVVVGAVTAAIMGIIQVLANVFANTIGPIIDTVAGVIGGVLDVISGLADFVAGVFTGDWSRAWDGIKSIFSGTWDAIVAVFKGIPETIWGIVTGLVEGIVDWFKWLWDVLVGHSIVPDMINDIVDWFQNAWDWIVEKVSGMVNAVITFFSDLKDSIVKSTQDAVSSVTGKFSDLGTWLSTNVEKIKDNVVSIFGKIYTGIKNKVTDAYNFVVKKFNDIKSWFGNNATKFYNKAKALGGKIKDGLINVVKTIKDAVASKINNIKTWISSNATKFFNKASYLGGKIKDGMVSAASKIKDAVAGKINDVKTWMGNAKDAFFSRAKSLGGSIKDGIVNVASKIKDAVAEKINGVKQWLIDKKSVFKEKATSFGNAIKDGVMVGINWLKNNIGNVMRKGINGAIDVINALIRGLNKIADIIPGLDWKIGEIGHVKLEQGGVIPQRQSVGSGFIARSARAIVGEGRTSYPEFVIPTDPTHRKRALALYESLGKKLAQGRSNYREKVSKNNSQIVGYVRHFREQMRNPNLDKQEKRRLADQLRSQWKQHREQEKLQYILYTRERDQIKQRMNLLRNQINASKKIDTKRRNEEVKHSRANVGIISDKNMHVARGPRDATGMSDKELMGITNSRTSVITPEAEALGIGGIGGWLKRQGSAAVDWAVDKGKDAIAAIFRPVYNLAKNSIGMLPWEPGRKILGGVLEHIWDWVEEGDSNLADIVKDIIGKWTNPIPLGYRKTSPYGYRIHPIYGYRKFHSGQDMAAPAGTPIRAAAAGYVNNLKKAGGLGTHVVMNHLGGIQTVYGHMARHAAKHGSAVTPGSIIGFVGSTGASTGPHLHFSVKKNGGFINPVDFMKSHGVALANGGIVRSRTGGVFANIGEAGRDEAVIPLPKNWKSILGSASNFGQMSSSTIRYVQIMGDVQVEKASMPVQNINNVYNFYGDLEFPNVQSGGDVNNFVRNLKDLAGN